LGGNVVSALLEVIVPLGVVAYALAASAAICPASVATNERSPVMGDSSV